VFHSFDNAPPSLAGGVLSHNVKALARASFRAIPANELLPNANIIQELESKVVSEFLSSLGALRYVGAVVSHLGAT
jgi:hypothetical protein